MIRKGIPVVTVWKRAPRRPPFRAFRRDIVLVLFLVTVDLARLAAMLARFRLELVHMVAGWSLEAPGRPVPVSARPAL